jgi:hypothetical protein
MTENEKKELKGRLLSFISRKFLIALVILIASTVMVMKDQLNATQWLSIVTADLITYDFSNAYSKKAKKGW